MATKKRNGTWNAPSSTVELDDGTIIRQGDDCSVMPAKLYDAFKAKQMIVEAKAVAKAKPKPKSSDAASDESA